MRSRTPYRISPWLSSKRTKSVTSTYVPSSARNRGSGCGCIAVSLCLCGLATACVSANRASTLPKKAGRQFVSIALSQRSAKSKKKHMFRGSLPIWEEGQWFPPWVHWTGHFFGFRTGDNTKYFLKAFCQTSHQSPCLHKLLLQSHHDQGLRWLWRSQPKLAAAQQVYRVKGGAAGDGKTQETQPSYIGRHGLSRPDSDK